MQQIIDYIYESHLSTTIRDVSWIIPLVQSIHILAIATLIGSALVTELRLAGVLATDESLQTVARRYMPWLWWALLVLALTGSIMVLGEPDRVLSNQVFWLKMGLVAAAGLITLLFRLPLLRREPGDRTPGSSIKLLAWMSLVLWVCVIFCGRWIAYVL